MPIKVNAESRPSRLITSTPIFILRSVLTIFRVFIIYAPVRFFAILLTLSLLPAIVIWFRFLYFFAAGGGQGHLQSLVLSIVLTILASFFALSGVIVHLMATNHLLLEEIRTKLTRLELDRRDSIHGNGGSRLDEPRD